VLSEEAAKAAPQALVHDRCPQRISKSPWTQSDAAEDEGLNSGFGGDGAQPGSSSTANRHKNEAHGVCRGSGQSSELSLEGAKETPTNSPRSTTLPHFSLPGNLDGKLASTQEKQSTSRARSATLAP
jgi:hypothetical protein